MAALYIGTSGWTYAGWRGIFYPPGLKRRELLSHYSRRFNSVEITECFERLPAESSFQTWARKTPENFVFPVMVSKHITYGKRLEGVAEEWQGFLDRVTPLGDKLGPLLFQFQPTFERDIGRIGRFLETARGAREHDLAMEFRHPSWFDPLALDDLRQLGVGVVIAQSERYPQAPRVPTTRFAYLRFHGPGQLFASSYSEEDLQPWARKIRKWLDQDRTVYAYFNNDFEGHAFANARALRRMVEGKPVSRSEEVAHH